MYKTEPGKGKFITNKGGGIPSLQWFVMPAHFHCHPRPFGLAQGRLRRGSAIILKGFSFLINLSLDVNISRSQGLTSFDCSLEKLTSRSKNKKNGSGFQVLCGQELFGQKLFLQEETLVTVSPCEFPPRGLITCVLSAISRNYNSLFCSGFIPAHKEPL